MIPRFHPPGPPPGTITTFGTPQDVTLQELRIECFFPADETTRALLAKR